MEGKRKMGKPYESFVMSMRNLGKNWGQEGWFCPIHRNQVKEWVDIDGNILKSKMEQRTLNARQIFTTKEKAIAGAKRFKQTVKTNESEIERNVKAQNKRAYTKFIERYY